MSSEPKLKQGYPTLDGLFENKGVTVEAAAEFWGVSAWTVRKWIRLGKVKAVKAHATSRRYLIPRKVLEDYTPAYREASDF